MGPKKRRRSQNSLHLTDKKHPVQAIGSTLLGSCSLLLFVADCFWSSQSHGKGGLGVGALGLLCFLLGICGFAMAWMSLHKENIRPLFPTVASVLNGLLVVFYMLIYIIGTFL